MDKAQFDGLVLMGPFGSGKTFLGKRLSALNIAQYVDLEPIMYDRFSSGDQFDLERATTFLREHYEEQLSTPHLATFESTGVVQRPLLCDMIAKYNIALIRVCTPKHICLERVVQRNRHTNRPIDLAKANEFFDHWNDEIAPTYNFALELDGMDTDTAVKNIQTLTTTVSPK